MRKAAPSFFLCALWEVCKQAKVGRGGSTYHNAGGEDDNGVRKYFMERFQVIKQSSLHSLTKSWEKNYGLSFKTPELNLPRNRLSLFHQGGLLYQSGQLSFIGKITNIAFQQQQQQLGLLHVGLRSSRGQPLELILLRVRLNHWHLRLRLTGDGNRYGCNIHGFAGRSTRSCIDSGWSDSRRVANQGRGFAVGINLSMRN